jgi:hypothetical protein
VKGYPTLMIHKKVDGSPQGEKYNGSRDVAKLAEFVKQ